MKISCLQENLNKGLSIVGRLTTTRSTLPILSNVLLKTKNGRLRISATNLEIGAHCFIGGKIEEEGEITVPARLLIDFVLMNNDKKINLKTEGTTLVLESERYKAKIKGLDASEFPLIPEIKEGISISIEAPKLKEAISQIIIATALDETKPVLTGVYFQIEGQQMKLAATDSFRLAEKILSLEKKVEKEVKVIIPSKTLSEVLRILSLGDFKEITLSFSENQVFFNFDDIQVISRIIEGNFPEYQAIIPKAPETIATLSNPEFLNALKIANLFAKDTGNNIKLKLEKENLIIQATSPFLGENTGTIPSSLEGPPLEISFNAKFLLDVLSVLPSPKITLGLSGKLNPGIIRPSGEKDYLYLIMPLKAE